jgi:hypothetical protein
VSRCRHNILLNSFVSLSFGLGFGSTLTKPSFKVAHQPLTNAINVCDLSRLQRNKFIYEPSRPPKKKKKDKIVYNFFFLAYNNLFLGLLQ